MSIHALPRLRLEVVLSLSLCRLRSSPVCFLRLKHAASCYTHADVLPSSSLRHCYFDSKMANQDIYRTPYDPVYGPTSVDSDEAYKATLTMPGRVAQTLFFTSHAFVGFVKNELGVSTVTDPPVGTIGDILYADDRVVTLEGARVLVEYCRAEMREIYLVDMMDNIKNESLRKRL